MNNIGRSTDNDVLALGSGISPDELWFRRVGSDLEISIIGTPDRLSLSGWYEEVSNHVGQISVESGMTLLGANVENLVVAMATFSPPPVGETELTVDQHQQLNAIIAANWKAA